MKGWAFLLVLASVVFAAGCPAGATDCFECGGVGGIPCAMSDSCSGSYVEGVGNVACACPPEGCECYCPYSEYGELKEELNPEGPLECPAKCTGGCSKGMTICVTKTEADFPSEGFAQIQWVQGEVFVRMPGGGWAWAKPGMKLVKGMEIRSGYQGDICVLVDDGSKFYIDDETTIMVAEMEKPPAKTSVEVIIELIKGAIFSDVTKRDGTRFEVDGGVSVTGVKGTQFEVISDGSTVQTKAYEGEVKVTSTQSGDSVDLVAGEKVSVSGGGLGETQVFDASVQDKWWEEGSGAGCCAAFWLIGAALGFAVLSAKGKRNIRLRGIG